MTTEQYSIGYDAGYQDGFDAALAEPVKQEPVAWGLTDETGEVLDCISNHYKTTQPCTVDYDLPLYAAPVDALSAERIKTILETERKRHAFELSMQEELFADKAEVIREALANARAEALEEAAEYVDRNLYTAGEYAEKLRERAAAIKGLK